MSFEVRKDTKMNYRTQLIMNVYNLYHNLHGKSPVHLNIDTMTEHNLELIEHELQCELLIKEDL